MSFHEGFTPDGYRRGEPVWGKKRVIGMAVAEICAPESNYFSGRVKTMSKDIDRAVQELTQAERRFDEILESFLRKEQQLADATKAVAGKVKRSANDLCDGLLKVSARADFDKLERHVELLERAEAAMSKLAELSKSGALERIAAAIK